MKNCARAVAGIALAGLAVVGCASGTDTASSGSAATAGSPATTSAQDQQNDADVAFAQGMIPHHRQAVEMASLAATQSQNPQVIDLASRIGSAQQPEIQTMTAWLQEWGAEVPAQGDMGDMGGMPGMDHSGTGGMSGMMTPEQMQLLGQVSGPTFDRMFLEMMIEHHQGAVEIAQTELQDGSDAEAKQLAQTIIDTQQNEITEMESLLQQV